VASPFTWNLTKPALSDIVANFPTQVAQPDKTTLATVLGTLNPFGTTTTGWRANQVNDSLWAAQNAAATGLLPSPGAPTLMASTSGGSLATGTVYVKVTALDVLNGLETTPSPEASVAVTGPSASVAVSWTAVSGAGAYRVYVGSTSGGENNYFQTTGTSYTVTTLTGTSGTPPTSTLTGTYNRDDTTKASLAFATDPSLPAWRWLYAAGAANPITWTEVMRLTSAGVLSVSSTLNAGSGSANYLQFLGEATGNNPQIVAQGSDPNIGINLIAQGTGGVNIFPTLNTGIGSANYLQFQGAPTGIAPQIVAQGSDANIGIILVSKGSKFVVLNKLNRLSFRTTGVSTTSTSIVSSGIGVGPITPQTLARFSVKAVLFATNATSGDNVVVELVRSTTGIPANGSALNSGDTGIAGGWTFSPSSANVKIPISFATDDTGLANGTAYYYYLAYYAAGGGTATISEAFVEAVEQ
jgi:hypothetical protein